MTEIITFPGRTLRPKRASTQDEPRQKLRVRNEGTMHTFLFRSYDLILESNEADLVRDVCLNIDRAQTKLRQIRERLQGVQEQAATQVQLLTAADTKLSAAIVAALLSNREG